jgi:hypothetical protein
MPASSPEFQAVPAEVLGPAALQLRRTEPVGAASIIFFICRILTRRILSLLARRMALVERVPRAEGVAAGSVSELLTLIGCWGEGLVDQILLAQGEGHQKVVRRSHLSILCSLFIRLLSILGTHIGVESFQKVFKIAIEGVWKSVWKSVLNEDWVSTAAGAPGQTGEGQAKEVRGRGGLQEGEADGVAHQRGPNGSAKLCAEAADAKRREEKAAAIQKEKDKELRKLEKKREADEAARIEYAARAKERAAKAEAEKKFADEAKAKAEAKAARKAKRAKEVQEELKEKAFLARQKAEKEKQLELIQKGFKKTRQPDGEEGDDEAGASASKTPNSPRSPRSPLRSKRANMVKHAEGEKAGREGEAAKEEKTTSGEKKENACTQLLRGRQRRSPALSHLHTGSCKIANEESSSSFTSKPSSPASPTPLARTTRTCPRPATDTAPHSAATRVDRCFQASHTHISPMIIRQRVRSIHCSR